MGTVWVAEHASLRTQVVVKFMAPELAANAEAVARFAREAAAASQVKSPHVVQMLDHGTTVEGLPYIVMEHLEGHDLGAHLEAHGKMRPRDVAEIVSQLARALARAHERGIVHRDIKPSNVFLCDAGDGQLFVKLLDFGIAKGVEGSLVDSKTRTGTMVGSPHYMSPEQVVGAKDIDARSDLWSLGVVAFEALTGHKPFDAETVGGLALKIHHEPLPKLTALAPELPAAVDAWFERACAREPSQRFASAKELADGLAAAIGGGAPVVSIVPAPLSSPRPVDELGFAKTSVDTGSGVAAVSSPRLPSGTAAGLAAAVPARERASRWPLLLAGAVVLAIAGGAGAFALRGGDRATPVTASAALPVPVAPPPLPSPSPTLSPMPPPIEVVGPVPPRPTASAAPTPARPRTVVKSAPSGSVEPAPSAPPTTTATLNAPPVW
jgi:serine/threonine-protein kinase